MYLKIPEGSYKNGTNFFSQNGLIIRDGGNMGKFKSYIPSSFFEGSRIYLFCI